MKDYVIEVTQGDIELGIEGSLCGCPIARALSRMFPGFNGVSRVSCEIDGSRYMLPDIAREFIRRFDRGLSVAPFTFTLSLPDPVEVA